MISQITELSHDVKKVLVYLAILEVDRTLGNLNLSILGNLF